MLVDVPDRSNWGGNGHVPVIRRVEIRDTCIRCGGLRGRKQVHHFAEDGAYYVVDRWDNPCGHVDKYEDVLVEARMLLEGESCPVCGGDPMNQGDPCPHCEYLPGTFIRTGLVAKEA